jgi:SM-20-related protein
MRQIMGNSGLTDIVGTDDAIDWRAFDRVPLRRYPFDYVVVPDFVPAQTAVAAGAAFPHPDLPGVLPAPTEPPENAFGQILRALRTPHTTEAFGRKFGLELDPDALMVTLRARTRLSDGRIHTDSETKVVTALLYLNDGWTHPGGQLRLLRGPHDIHDTIAEVAPLAGTLLAFRRTARSWHGHLPFEGVRRAIMFNWMVDAATARRETRRHVVSATMKTFFGKD